MNTNELPLQQLFTKLREAGLPLGIDEYQLLLRSLQAGFGVTDKAALKRLCQTLWVKSAEEKAVLEYHFEQVISSDAVALISGQDSETIDKSQLGLIYRIITYIILGVLEIGIVFCIRESKQPLTTQQAQPENTTLTTQQTQPETTTLITQQTQPETTTVWIVWMVLLLSATTCGYLLFRLLSHSLSKLKQSKEKAKPNLTSPSYAPKSKLIQTPEDEKQIVKLLLQTSNRDLSSDFFPVTQRQMKQFWLRSCTWKC